MDWKPIKFKKLPKDTQRKTLDKINDRTKLKDVLNPLRGTSAIERKSGVTASRPKAVKSDHQKSVKAYKSKK